MPKRGSYVGDLMLLRGGGDITRIYSRSVLMVLFDSLARGTIYGVGRWFHNV